MAGLGLASVTYAREGWVCRYDVAQACGRALAFEVEGYTAFHVIGAAGARDRFDVARTETELGVEFENRFEAYGA